MEQKTILEELLERSPDDKKYRTRLETAYRLSAKGKYEEAAVIFDELLEENPDDREAASGKKLNDRRISLDSRISSLSERQREKAVGAKSSAEKSGTSLLRSKRVLTAIVIAFVIVCAAAAAVIGIDQYESDIDEIGTETGEYIDG